MFDYFSKLAICKHRYFFRNLGKNFCVKFHVNALKVKVLFTRILVVGGWERTRSEISTYTQNTTKNGQKSKAVPTTLTQDHAVVQIYISNIHMKGQPCN